MSCCAYRKQVSKNRIPSNNTKIYSRNNENSKAIKNILPSLKQYTKEISEKVSTDHKFSV